MTRKIYGKEISHEIKGSKGFTTEVYEAFKGKSTSIIPKLFQKIVENYLNVSL